MRCAPVLAAALSLASTASLAQPPAVPSPSGPPPQGPGVTVAAATPDHDRLENGILVLAVGRTITVTLGDKNVMAFDSEGVADPSVIDMPANQPNGYTTGVTGMRLKRVEKDKLTFTLLRNPHGGAVLIFQNGVDRPMSLVAMTSLVADGKRRATLSTICTAVPGHPDIETWPNEYDVVVVPQVINTQQGTCYDPNAKAVYKDGDQPPSARPPATTPPAGTSPTP